MYVDEKKWDVRDMSENSLQIHHAFLRHQWHRREKTLTSKQWQNTRSDVIRDDVIRIMSCLIPDKGLNHFDLISPSAHFTSRVCDIWIMVLVLDKCYDNRHFRSFGPHYRSCMRAHSQDVRVDSCTVLHCARSMRGSPDPGVRSDLHKQ